MKKTKKLVILALACMAAFGGIAQTPSQFLGSVPSTQYLLKQSGGGFILLQSGGKIIL